MSQEVGVTPEIRSSRIAELINPVNLPEAGFQSYEELKNDAVAQKERFLSDEIEMPVLDYPAFQNLSGMDKGILKLADAAEKVSRIEADPDKAAVIAQSLEFRMAEMEYIKILAQLDFLCKEGADPEAIAATAEEARELNEQLYGKPKPEITDAALNAIWETIDQKDLSSSAQVLRQELADGFVWDGRKTIPALPRSENREAKLPSFDDEHLEWAGENILEEYSDIEALVYELWEAKIETHGDAYTAQPEDIAEIFDNVLRLLDPEESSGVRIIIDPNATALSWETPLMAVKVGGKRVPIESREEMFEKVLHELVVHGGRTISGLASGLPVLGTGLYTQTPRPDYLTFEEGFATTVEEVVSPEQPKWDGTKLAHYVSISLGERGGDFRSVFEVTWRYRLLMDLDDAQEVTDEMIEKCRKAAYTSCVRVFRGTQTNLQDIVPGITPMTFNKDLAYLEGRVIAMEHLKTLHETRDLAGLRRLFKAKYDPTNPVQDMLVKREFPDQ